MILGALWCFTAKAHEAAARLREIKRKHGLHPDFEIKWSKVSPAGKAFYLDVVDYFLDDDDLHFRGLVAKRSGLNHEQFGQSHDEWYFKMYYQMLTAVLRRDKRFLVYLDIKDTRSGEKVRHLHDVLARSFHDFSKNIVERVQIVRSEEVQCMQLADLLIGAVGYAHRDLSQNAGKVAVVDRIKGRLKLSLKKSTLPKEEKFNLFIWEPRVGGSE